MADTPECEVTISIEILDNDCLESIFRHLPIIERIKIERVSKRWNEVSKSSWSNVKKLDLQPQSWGFKPRGYLFDSSRRIQLFELIEVVIRCGQFLEVIDVYNMLSKVKLDVILPYCKNIKSLTTYNNYGISAIAENCKNIVKLNLDCYLSNDEPLIYLFKENKNLKILKMVRFPHISGSCLLYLPMLEKLYLHGHFYNLKLEHLTDALKIMNNLKVFSAEFYCDQMNHAIITVLQNHSNLEELHLELWKYDISSYYEEFFSDDKIQLVFKNNQKLKILRLQEFSYLTGKCLFDLNDYIEELILMYCRNFDCKYLNKYIFKFSKLKKFEFCDCNRNLENCNELIKFISELVNLKCLKIDIDVDIWNANSLTAILALNNLEELELNSRFITAISALINLEEFELRNPFITDKALINFELKLKKLKKLTLSYCKNVTDNGLYAITSLPKLESLVLIHMDKITDKGFNKMENLKILKCSSCRNIKNDCFKKILIESEKIEYLYINYCSVTDDILLFANEITKKRSSTILHICLNNLMPGFEELKNVEKSAFLEYYDDFLN